MTEVQEDLWRKIDGVVCILGFWTRAVGAIAGKAKVRHFDVLMVVNKQVADAEAPWPRVPS
jgi:hypothetical protein